MTAFPPSIPSISAANGAAVAAGTSLDSSTSSAVPGPSSSALIPANGTASSSEQKPKRPRQSKPKVKTGCSNCKQRRIKCDEKRPECTQCTRSNRTCTGYPPPSRSARSHEVISIAPKPKPLQPISVLPLGSARPLQPIPFAVTRGGPVQLTPRLRRQNKMHHRLVPNGAIAPPLIQTMPPTLRFVGDEELYFQLFRTQTACELSGYFDSVFWTKSVLMECHYSDIIKHAVVALGALYRTLESKTQTPPSSPSNRTYRPETDAARHWSFAIKTYGYAINALLESTKSSKSTPRVQLMANVLFACFDSFIGDHRQAIVQIQTGLGLLEKLRETRRRAFSYVGGEPVEEELLQMFTRLAIQAKSYDMAFHFPEPYVIRLVSDPIMGGSPQSEDDSLSESGSFRHFRHTHIPPQFDSLIEARVVWDKLLETIFIFTETLFAVQQAGKSAPMGLLSPKFMEYGMGFRGQLEAWGFAYNPIMMRRLSPEITHQEKAGIAVLKMTHMMSTVLFNMTFSKAERDFDRYNELFDGIVSLAFEVVADEEKRAADVRCPRPELCTHRRYDSRGYLLPASHIKPSFSADLGIIPPLFVVATKCRHPLIRRRAIQLLQCTSRREGMWDSQLSALIGEYIMNLEEEEEPQVRVWDMGDGSSVSSPDSHAANGARSPSPGVAGGVAYGNGNEHNSPSPTSSVGAYPITPVSPYSTPAATVAAPQVLPHRPVSSQQQQQQHEASHIHTSYVSLNDQSHVIPESRRLMVQAVEFDLRARTAFLELGTRGKIPGSVDSKTRKQHLSWGP